ncbi:glycosyltransferase family 39 protein [Nostoc sp. 106C]|uniref:glycosyltransferase family 39 protein n=1 Tax=Nostoc sp. 106C TaxID=1932667 RepID=UPI001181575A|nr:glycosyltransferase family 39 protein [Nostoc sp. 106C]
MFRSYNKKIKLSIFFISALVTLYLGIFFFLNKLQFPPMWDEKSFWRTSLLFSNSLIPDLEQLKNYAELNTPLPFIIFGILEYLFHGGLFAGRLLNLLLSFVIVCLIGFSSRKNKKSSLLSAFGLLLCPYYLMYSVFLYTDNIAIFFVLLGFWFYTRSHHILSSLAFILAIASRQYMLAFPVAIAVYELLTSRQTGVKLRIQLLAPVVALSSIFVWIWLFGGLAPKAGLGKEATPVVQQLAWSFSVNGSLFFLSWVGLHFVIPEWLLFSRKLQKQKLFTPKNFVIAATLLPLFLIFSSPLQSHGLIAKLTGFLPGNLFKIAVFYALALLTCVRFSRINLAFWLLVMNCGIMLKAYPWEKYVLPLVVVLWYLKSLNLLDKTLKHSVPNTSN